MKSYTVRKLVYVLIALSPLGLIPLFQNADYRFAVMDAVSVSVGFGVLAAYFAGAREWFGIKETRPAHLLILGIMCTWMASVIRHGWLGTWRLLGKPEDFFDHWIVSVSIYLFILGGALHLIAQRAIEDRIPVSGWALLGAMVILGLLLGLGFIMWV